MLKTISFSIALTLSTILAVCQDYAGQFESLLSGNDTSAQGKVLTEWAKASPKDPELFIAYFNFYVRKSMSEVVSLDNTQKNYDALALNDTATGNPVAFLNSSKKYKPEVLQTGFHYINQGIDLFPKRLDMRFGKIYILGQAENYTEFTKEIVAAIDYGVKINNSWLWKEGKLLENPKAFFLSSLQDYVATIYNTEDDSLLPLMRRISEAVIKYYPDHVESLSNVALTYLITGEFEKALPFLLKAEQVAPRDIVVLNNIAIAYKRKGDKINAKAYYEKIISYGNKEEALDAQQQLKIL
jgi:tetratricopeptide (TPR) repeat protein